MNGKEVIGKFFENNEIVIIIDTKVLNTKVKENDIKSIVTHEQFDQVKYEV